MIIKECNRISSGSWWNLKLVVLLAMFVLFAACSSVGPTSDQKNPKKSNPHESSMVDIVTTTNIVGDWVRNIGGELVTVTALVPPGKDPHSYVPTANDIVRLIDSDLIINVGLGFEGVRYEDLVHNAIDEDSKIVTLGTVINPIKFAGGRHEHGGEDGHGNGEMQENISAYDPHFWFDPHRVKMAVSFISDNLSSFDPSNSESYLTNAMVYKQQMDGLHQWITSRVGHLPVADRTLVTSHHSMQYFADLYGFDVIGSVIPSVGTEVEPSSEHMAALVKIINDLGVPTIFGEVGVSERIANAVALETDAHLVRLNLGSLDMSDPEVSTYISMVKSNVNKIVDSLKK